MNPITCIYLKSSRSQSREYFTVSRALDKSINTKQKQQSNSPSYPGNSVCHLIDKWVVCRIIFHLRYKHRISSSVSVINKQCIYPKCTECVSFYCNRYPGGTFYWASTQSFTSKPSMPLTFYTSYSASPTLNSICQM